ncbi:uridine kinase family protein [Streptococcus merionis]|uniref:Phosphoribulokinase/uridine kinase family protein n=1 Tax=Streptococcus merionis TaxID=400065 RepID=A0A239SLZ0_9STRE|nr:AAA family ATPase [Streptococcus merionis]SNU86299.1 phosphoribulokinase/uridine kinase family protein [Streptococcus merionis]
METLLTEILAFIAKREKTVIRICGHGGSGKSTFAQQLLQALPAGEANLLSCDPYIILGKYSQDALLSYDIDGQSTQHAITACHPLRHELSGLRRDLQMLAAGMDILTIDTPWQAQERLMAKRSVTIVEGMTPTFLEADLFDLSIFIYTDGETELMRRLARDTSQRGRDASFVQQTHAHRRRQYELYMAPLMSTFDLVINQSANDFVVERSIFSRD